MWSPSGWDKFLPADLYAEAKVIGGRLYARLKKEWSEEKKDSFFKQDDDDYYDLWLDKKEVFRILVSAFMDELPANDPDIVAYKNLRVEADARYDAYKRRIKNKRARERAKNRKRMKRLANLVPTPSSLPGI